MAARAGVDPWEYSLHELYIRWQAIQLEEWDKVGWLAMHSVAPWSKKRLKLTDFQPVRMGQKASNASALKKHIERMRTQIQKRGMTEEESYKLYDELYRRQ